jgi:hypothetical protein
VGWAGQGGVEVSPILREAFDIIAVLVMVVVILFCAVIL